MNAALYPDIHQYFREAGPALGDLGNGGPGVHSAWC